MGTSKLKVAILKFDMQSGNVDSQADTKDKSTWE